MSLSRQPVHATVAVSDLAAATEFYEAALGLRPAEETVSDVGAVVAEFAAPGVVFERYGGPVRTDERGVHDAGYVKLAWFRDPDGNTFALQQTVVAGAALSDRPG